MPLRQAHILIDDLVFLVINISRSNKDVVNNENTLLVEQWCWIDPAYELLRDVIVVTLSVLHITCSRLHYSLDHENIAYQHTGW